MYLILLFRKIMLPWLSNLLSLNNFRCGRMNVQKVSVIYSFIQLQNTIFIFVSSNVDSLNYYDNILYILIAWN